MTRAAVAALIALVAAPSGARGDDPAGAASAHMHARYAYVDEPALAGGLRHVAAVGIRARGAYGKRAAYCFGFDTEVGGSDEGFVYDVETYLAGFSLRLNGSGTLGVCAGLGFGGVSDAIPVAAQFPIEAALELDMGPTRAIVWARATWTAGPDSRSRGSPTFSRVDEVSAMAALRIGRRVRKWRPADAGNGYFVGATYREAMGTRFFGAVIGYGVSAAIR